MIIEVYIQGNNRIKDSIGIGTRYIFLWGREGRAHLGNSCGFAEVYNCQAYLQHLLDISSKTTLSLIVKLRNLMYIVKQIRIINLMTVSA